MRPSGRAPDQMRELTFEPGFTRHAEGSCLVSFGDTRVLCTASVEEKVPPFLRGKGQGWVTAEYGMLPRATHTRGNREAAKGKQSGRTQEIQRLIGRSLRAVVDLPKLGERQIIVDCDVIQADGGTRTASISGAWVALRIAVDKLLASKAIAADPIRTQVAAVSCGIHNGNAVLDLDYDEDSTAGSDGNFVLTADGAIVEAQVTAEGETLRRGRAAAPAPPRAHRLRRDLRRAAEGDRPVRPIGGKLVIASHNPGKLREIADAARAARHRLRRRRGARPSRARGDRHHLRRQCRSEGARGGRSSAACPRSPTIAACASMRCTAVPASSRRAGPRTKTASATGCARWRRSGAKCEATEPDAAPAAHFVCALAIAWPERRPGRDVRGPGRRHARLAAARRQAASATTRCSCRSATTRPSARWTRSRSTR